MYGKLNHRSKKQQQQKQQSLPTRNGEKKFKNSKRQRLTPLTISKKGLSLLAIFSFVIIAIHYRDFLFFHRRREPLQPPSSVSIHAKRRSFTKVPENSRKTFYINPTNPFRPVVARAFRTQGWRPADSYAQAQFVWDKLCNHSRYDTLQKYQRYSYYPNWIVWDDKDSFLQGMQSYAKQTKQELYMIPETYQLGDSISRDMFRKRLEENGMHIPWVLKRPTVNNGKGITMLPPNSKELEKVRDDIEVKAAEQSLQDSDDNGDNNGRGITMLPPKSKELEKVRDDVEVTAAEQKLQGSDDKDGKPERHDGRGMTILPPNIKEELDKVLHDIEVKATQQNLQDSDDKGDKPERRVVQAYICHELTWFLKPSTPKFDLRFYWMVASLDPLVVLYHDGYVRVGNAPYDESNWASTTRHLTTHTYLSTEDKGTMNELELLLTQHARNNPQLPYLVRKDPLEHVRNQCRQAIAHTVRAFLHKTFGHHGSTKFTAEGAYGFYGADFILDEDLHVWYIEAQAGPGMEEEFDFRVDMHRDLLRSMIGVVEEIQMQMEADPQRNVFPLQELGGWDVVYAGTDGENTWWYEYMEYTNFLKANPKTSGCQITKEKPKKIKV